MIRMPKISVIMPLFNAEKYVAKAIESILRQTFTDFELIMIDDCSTDGTMSVVNGIKDYRIKIIKNSKNSGIAYSRNIGLKNASGEYIAFMDDDDIAPVDRLETEVKYLDEHLDIDVVGGRYCAIDENDILLLDYGTPLCNPEFIRATLMFYDPIGNGSIMMRSSLIRKNNLSFSDKCYGMEDYKFWIDCSVVGRITNIDKVLLLWRTNHGSETLRMVKNLKTERAEKFAQLQQYALSKNGIVLDEEEAIFFNAMFPEGKFSRPISTEEIVKIYKILNKISRKAKELRLNNANEIKICCKKQFSRRIECSNIWD